MTAAPKLPDLEYYCFDGKRVLQDILRDSMFNSPAQAVAALTKFCHPDTVAQTRNQNLFRTIRRTNNADVGKYLDDASVGRIMLDDNKSPTDAFIWSNKLTRGICRDVHFSHIWSAAKDVTIYTSLANICLIPAFLAKLTDTDTEVCALLKYRAYHLFAGFKPNNEDAPIKPIGYDELEWAEPLSIVSNLEMHLRRAIHTKPKDRTVCAIRELGWFFSGYSPDRT